MNTTTEALTVPSRTATAGRRVATERGIEAVYRAEAARFRKLAAAVAGPDVASDVVQDAFALALRKSGSWRGDGPLEAWLWRLVLNAARDAGRRRLRRQRLGARLLQVTSRPVVPEVSDESAIDGPLRQLPPRQRDCVVLRYYGDLSYAEIAGVMGIATGTVGALLAKAHAALRAALAQEDQQ